MKIVHLSCHDVNGGAARAAWRVHQSLRLVGVDSSMFVAERHSHDPDVTRYTPGPAPIARLRRTLRRERLAWELTRASRHRPAGFDHFRDDRSPFGPGVGKDAPAADIYHLHQVTDFLDYRASLARLAARAPIVWTLHEMTPFTGGCHYAYECQGFTGECGACPQLGSRRRRDLSRAIWMRKRRVYDQIAADRIHVVGASRWIAAEASRSSLFRRFSVSVIPYGLDTTTFQRLAGACQLREAFGIARSARVILFLADYTGSRRKGFALLDSALGALRCVHDTVLLSLGRDRPSLQSRLPHVHVGAVADDRLIAAMYSMADVFAVPSLHDNLPNTVLEAMACGTPVVGFDVGGIPDMVRHGENGLLAPVGDVAGLATALDALLSDDVRRTAMGSAGRAVVEREFTLALQAQRYVRLYETLVSDLAPTAARGRSRGAG